MLLVKYSWYLPLPTCSCSNLLFVLTLLCNPYLALQLDDVDVNVDKSRTIGGMVRRMDRNKWIIGLVIAVLVLVILVILYFKFVH